MTVSHRILAVPLLLVLGCGGSAKPTAYARSFARAERAESAGRFAEAARSYDDASREAPSPRERDHARYLAGVVLDRAGDRSSAAERFRPLAEQPVPGEDSAAAAYRLAEMRIEEGDDRGGFGAMDGVVRRFPSSGVARPALHRFVRHMDDEQGPARTLDYLRSLEPSLGGTERGEEIAYEIALRLAALDRTQEARDAFLSIATRWPYPFGALWDDSLFRASELDEKLGRYSEAIEDLERMLKERESSTVVGSYQRPRFGEAQMRVAILYRDRLHDHARARAELHRLYADFSTSTLRDRALWLEAAIARDDGDGGSACSTLETLIDDFPDSRFVPCAVDQCPGLHRPGKSKAPATCHPYIERGVR